MAPYSLLLGPRASKRWIQLVRFGRALVCDHFPAALLGFFFVCGCVLAISGNAQPSNALPLTVVCPTSAVVPFQSETGTVATFTVTVTGGCSQPAISFQPPSGSMFQIGTTPVTLLVTDACSSVECIFDVTVRGPRDIKSGMVADMLALQFAAKTRPDRKGLTTVVRRLTASLDADFWVDQTHLVTNHGSTVFSQEKGAVSMLHSLQVNKRSDLSDDALQKFIDQLVASDRLLAAVRIQDAAATSSNSNKIAQARSELAKGDQEVVKNHGSTAIGHYQTAWTRVSKL